MSHAPGNLQVAPSFNPITKKMHQLKASVDSRSEQGFFLYTHSCIADDGKKPDVSNQPVSRDIFPGEAVSPQNPQVDMKFN